MPSEVNKVFATIKELGHVNSKREELRGYCAANIDQILQGFSHRILSSDGADMLDCLLNGLPDQPSAKTKVKVIDIVLKTLRHELTSLNHCGEVVSRVCLELSRLPAMDLLQWCNDSIQSIVDDKDANMIWRDILPECLNRISSHLSIMHCGTEMSGSEFHDQCIRTLCQCNWNEKQLVQLAAMFRDMQLAKNDHKQVVNKICSYMIDVPPGTLPPLVNQLLKLCKVHHVEIVLAHVAHYFNIRIYTKLEPPSPDSESTTMEISDFAQYSTNELNTCLSTCIYHVAQGAAEPEVIRKHLKSWSKTELLKSPFLLDLALALSDKGADFRTVCLDVIRAAIEQSVLDQQRVQESAWIRSVIPSSVNVAVVLKILTTESATHNQLTTMGLINLAFVLLSTSHVKSVAPACWSHGKLILVRMAKNQPDTARYIISQLADRLAADSTALRQYSSCLYVLCKLTPMSVERCTQIPTILENCQPATSDYRSAAAVLEAVHPLLNFSTRIRDSLVMVCRKGLHSRDSLHRCLALSGFLSVLRHIKLPRGPLSSSQTQLSDQFSNHSYLTQLSVDMHATQQGVAVTSRVRNEAICMEVVSILRRCLVQDAPVKTLLYSSIYDSAKEKLILHEAILELLYEHVSKYLSEGESLAILFEKCIKINATEAVLLEPIGQLLYSIARFLQQDYEDDLEDILASETVDTGSAHLKSKLEATLERLTSNEELANIEKDIGVSLTDLTPESKAKCLKLQQRLQCLEALIAHQIIQWSLSSTDVASKINKLFRLYNQLLDHTKVPPKSGKKGGKTLNETKGTQRSQKSQKSQKEKQKGVGKFTSLTRDRAGPFKPLPCVWDLSLCERVVQLLYSVDVPWASVEQRNKVRTKRDFHHFALRNVQAVVTGGDFDKCHIVAHVPQIAKTLYTRCLARFRDMCDFEEHTALMCVEVLKDCLVLMFKFHLELKINSLLPIVTETSEGDAPEAAAVILERVHAAFSQVDAETSSQADKDGLSKKLVTALVQLATVLLDNVLDCNVALTNATNQLEQHVRVTQCDCVALLPPLLSASCRRHQEGALFDDLIARLATVMGVIDEENTPAVGDPDSFPAIDDKSCQAVLGHACVHLNARYKHAEHLLARAKDLQGALSCSTRAHSLTIGKDLRDLYKSLVVQLSQLSAWTERLVNVQFPVGTASDRVLLACTRLYALLAAFVKHLASYVGQDATLLHPMRLERLLKVSGKKLSQVVDNAITYVEASQGKRGGAGAGAAGGVLRDTRHIPRLVLEAERFSEHCLLLSNSTKVNLQQYLSLGTARDFRIKAPVLHEVLNARVADADQDADDGIETIGDDITMAASPTGREEDQSIGAEDTTNAKRRRIS